MTRLEILAMWKAAAQSDGLTVEDVHTHSQMPLDRLRRAWDGSIEDGSHGATTGYIVQLFRAIGRTATFAVAGMEDVTPHIAGPCGRLAEAIYKERTKRHWGQVDVSAAAGVSRVSVHNVERGRTIAWSTIERVCEALGLEPVCVVE